MCRLHKAATSQCARPSRADHTSLPLQLRSIPALHLACEFRPIQLEAPISEVDVDALLITQSIFNIDINIGPALFPKHLDERHVPQRQVILQEISRDQHIGVCAEGKIPNRGWTQCDDAMA